MGGRAVGLGVFDGVHLGHMKLLNCVREYATSNEIISSVITFHPHPLTVLQRNKAPLQINDLNSRIELIESMGIEEVNVIPFSTDIANKEPHDFIKDILIDKFKVKFIVVGFNYIFGRGGKGNTSVLRALGARYGVETVVITPVKIRGHIVGSTFIRELINNGKVEDAREFLGRYHFVKGKVVSGYGRGKKIGYPTANLDVCNNIIIPSDGVYICNVKLGKLNYHGLCNIGMNPTFGINKKSLEVYIMDFNEEIYGQDLKIEFIKRIREEKVFDNIDELRTEIENNLKVAREYIKLHFEHQGANNTKSQKK